MSATHDGDALVRSVGMFGGTFDPIHIGHLVLAERAREELGLDRVLFVPANIPPHKQEGRLIAAPEHRIEMLRLAIGGNASFELSTHEIDREGISYTVDTLRHFEELRPGARFTLLIGGDNARDFHTWRHPETIVELARVAVWARPGSELPSEVLPGVGYHRIASPLLEISSTEIRERARSLRSIRYMVTDAVADYIERHELYR
jgi:nicotinate-nucleotide adenylyltransferase